MLMRRVICNMFETDEDVQVAGEAGNGAEALEMLPRLDPDVVTMDINMPVMDGMTALKHIMIKRPKPIVMVSTLTQKGADVTFDALKYGAVDFIPKPSKLRGIDLEKQKKDMVTKLRLAAGVEIGAVRYLRSVPRGDTSVIVFCEECGEKNFIDTYKMKGNAVSFRCPVCNSMTTVSTSKTGRARKTKCDYVVAMGASEGGYGALLKIIPGLLADIPAAFLVVLYEASQHVQAFARYLDHNSPLKIKRAMDGEPLEGGVCYLAPGDQYVTINPQDGRHLLHVNPSPFPTHRSSINMLMFSLAEVMKDRAVGAVLSGSGTDGTEGLAEILRMGGTAIVQDPRTCLCKEMARYAIDRCKVDSVVSDTRMTAEMIRVCRLSRLAKLKAESR